MGKYDDIDVNDILTSLEKTEAKSDNKDFSNDYRWKPTIEKNEERVEYVIRFLPNPDANEKWHWVDRAAHMFEFPSGKYVYEPCPKKAKKGDCYFCEQVSELFNSGDMGKEALGKKRFAKKRFYHNVLIVKDERDGGKNEGKVMVFEYGQQIHDKIIEFMGNKDLDPAERLYFHPTYGTDFRLVMTWKSDYQNYEKSDFARRTSGIKVNGEELNAADVEKFIDDNAYSLNEKILGDKNFKGYDKLKEVYLNQGVVSEQRTTTSTTGEEIEEEIDDDVDVTIRNPEEKVKADKKVTSQKISVDDDDDEPPFDTEDTDDDEELQALLND
jgi:hypothetical protein